MKRKMTVMMMKGKTWFQGSKSAKWSKMALKVSLLEIR